MQIGLLTNWADVSAISSGLGLKTDGTLWAWGQNNHGQLGLGDTVTRKVHTQVGTDTDWAFISAASFAAGAIKQDGSLWTWGRGEQGTLGQGDLLDRYVPTRVGVENGWVGLPGRSAVGFFAIKAV
jgi:alpha-tubulin suppressor-like RCC1 family protein